MSTYAPANVSSCMPAGTKGKKGTEVHLTRVQKEEKGKERQHINRGHSVRQLTARMKASSLFPDNVYEVCESDQSDALLVLHMRRTVAVSTL